MCGAKQRETKILPTYNGNLQHDPDGRRFQPDIVRPGSGRIGLAGDYRDGVTNPATFTLDQLKDMEQCQYLYSCINTWPTKKWYVGKGVRLS